MAKKYKLYQVDSFTKARFQGNPAGVVPYADGLTEEQMLKIARELNNSETAFIFKSKSNDYDIEVRFFTPSREVPICGHATIAAHYIWAKENKLSSCRIYQKTKAGILPVDLLAGAEDYKMVMTQGKIEFGDVLEGEILEKLYQALHLSKEECLESCPVQIVSTGHSKVMVGIKAVEKLHQLNPNMEELIQISQQIQCNGFYVFTLGNFDEEPLVHGRMFAPAIGITEDPVTGNANGPLGAYLVHHGLIPTNREKVAFKIIQGETINRAGMMEVQVAIEKGEPVEVKIVGEAVTAFETEIII